MKSIYPHYKSLDEVSSIPLSLRASYKMCDFIKRSYKCGCDPHYLVKAWCINYQRSAHPLSAARYSKVRLSLSNSNEAEGFTKI